MYLKSLEMLGFKSFAEARIQFPEGVTAVVGPNGSGKSNVVDAILWVLGEQSTKTLRSERMEDVIFNGTEVRKPLGMAEVSLVIGGLDNVKLEGVTGLPAQLGEYQELMITRRLYRNGDSEYLINKAPCRLKDVRSLLLDTRAGTKGHTVIAQGQIDHILNASPQDRRELIEETAGIVRYKKQKAEALRKLDATQQNLLRVRDIVAEVKKQLNSLERQARQARSYQTLHQEAKTLEIELLTREYRALRATLLGIEEELHELDGQESAHAAEQSRMHAELEHARLTVLTAGETIAAIREELSAVEQQQGQALTAAEVERNRGQLYDEQRTQGTQELDRLALEEERARADIERLRETIATLESELTERETLLRDLDDQMNALLRQRTAAVAEEERGRRDVLNLAVLVANTEQAVAQLSARLSEAATRGERLARERSEFEAQRAAAVDKELSLQRESGEASRLAVTLRERQQEVHAEAEQVAAGLTELDAVVLRQSEELAAVDSHLRAVQSMVREEMGYGRRGEDEATSLKACEGVNEALAEWLVVPSGMERAVESFLGERVRGWFVEGPAAASRAIAFLREKELGRGTFLPQHPRWSGKPQAGDWWAALAGQPGVLGRAVDLIEADGPRIPSRDYLFDRVVFVETLEDAVRLWDRQTWSAPDGPILVALTGEIVDAAGIVTGGQANSEGGLLQRRREAMELEARRRDLVGAVEEGKRRRDELTARAQSLRDDERRLADELRAAEMQDLSLRKDHVGLQQLLADLERRAEDVGAEIQKGIAESQRVEQERASTQAQLEQWIRETSGQEANLASVRGRLEQIEQETRALQERLTEARMSAESMRTTGQHHESDLARLLQEAETAAARRRDLIQHVETLSTSIEQSRLERERQEGLCRQLGEEALRVKARLVEAQERQAQDMAVAHGLEQSLEDVRRLLSAVRDARMAVEVRRAEVRMQLGTVEGTLTGTYQVDVLALTLRENGRTELEQEPAVEPVAETEGAVSRPDAELKEQLQKIRERLDRMGPINLAAINEHQELEERYRFLSSQEQDLSASITSLKEIIQRINRTTKEMFVETFAELQGKFGEVFTKFFPGGRAELILVDEPVEEGAEGNGSQEPGVDIVAQPPGKRLKSITMLSGGEKTLTAMALLFASFLIRPTPFCILDEIDAPLDEENIGRFTEVLCELARSAQFLVITHNKRTMSIADSLFGVTMEEPGISKLVSVRLADLQPA